MLHELHVVLVKRAVWQGQYAVDAVETHEMLVVLEMTRTGRTITIESVRPMPRLDRTTAAFRAALEREVRAQLGVREAHVSFSKGALQQ